MALGLHRNVVEQAGGAGAMADLGGCGGGFAALDAVEPVTVLVVALVEMHLVGADDGVENLWIAGHEGFDLRSLAGGFGGGGHLVAGDEDPALGAVPLDAVREVAGDVHGDAVGVDGMGEEFSVDVPEAGRGELCGAPDFNGAG